MEPILVRLSVESLRYQVVQAFTAKQAELTTLLEQEVNKAITDFDFEQTVQDEVSKILPQLIHDVIAASLREALMQEGPVKTKIDALVQEAFHRFATE